MIELHGWFRIREAFQEVHESEEKLADAIVQIGLAIDELSESNLFAKLVTQNGSHTLLMNCNFNHRDSRWIATIGLVELVSRIAPGSFGILHFHDDEDRGGRENQFQKLVVKKGKILTYVDEHLSPIFDELEEL